MPITISLTFDDTWAARLAPVVQAKVNDIRAHPIVVGLLAAQGVDSVDDLTVKQQAKLLILFDLLRYTQMHEGDEAERAARQAVVDDVADNFPLEID